jgi:hypothetical protein
LFFISFTKANSIVLAYFTPVAGQIFACRNREQQRHARGRGHLQEFATRGVAEAEAEASHRQAIPAPLSAWKRLPLHILIPMQQLRRGNMAAHSSVTDDLMRPACWGLTAARAQAQRLLARSDRRRTARQLVAALSTNDPEQRVRAADVARRITERDADFLVTHATEIASILADTPLTESRTRWHLGLVAARSARTPQQIRLAAAILWQLAEDKSNVVRCSAVEGLDLLARRDRGLLSTVEPFLHQALVTGTPAMRVRARNALCWLQANRRKRVRARSKSTDSLR